MSRSVITNADFLKALHNLKPSHRVVLLRNADCSNVQCICECVYNILNGKVPLNKNQRDRLGRYKTTLRKLIKRGENWKKKKKILVQSGGAFLPLLLAPLLSGVLSSLFERKN